MSSSGALIAVVDDEPTVCAMLARRLRLANYRVSLFASGPEFLASLNVTSPDCAVIDIHMPEVSGLEVRAIMRAAHVEVPVVFITAGAEPHLEESAAELGALALLRKPFSGDALLEAIELAFQVKN